MSSGFGSFGNGPDSYVSYKAYKESQKGGGTKGPSSKSGCMMAIVLALAVVILVCTFGIC